MSRRVVTNQEIKQWRSIQGWYYKDIAEIYGVHECTVQFHLTSKKARERRRKQWREAKRKHYAKLKENGASTT